MQVIPAIDLLDGRVVRLHKGDYEQVTAYNDDPVAEARIFSDAGFDHIHVVDLNGAREGEFVNLELIREIIRTTGLSVQTGGGIRTFDDAEMLLEQGIAKVICSSMAVRNPEEWLALLDNYGHRTILGMDLKDGRVAYSGWEKTVDDSLSDFLGPMIEHGLKEVLCTDISRDGTLEGPNIPLYIDLMNRFGNLEFIASGGVSNVEDLETLADQNLSAVVVGRAYYEKKLSLQDMVAFNSPSKGTD